MELRKELSPYLSLVAAITFAVAAIFVADSHCPLLALFPSAVALVWAAAFGVEAADLDNEDELRRLAKSEYARGVKDAMAAADELRKAGAV